jgi:predicted O-linked N-acetylglucosamine transferase (SPINDLY family)
MARNRGRRKAHQPTSAQPPKSRAQGRRPAPDKFASLIQTAFTYHQAGDLGTAQAIYDEVLTSQPGHAEALQLSGAACIEQGAHARAAELLERAARRLPASAAVQSNLSLAYFKLERYADAERAAQRALALQPDHAEALNNLGNAQRLLGKDAEARTSYTACLKAQPDHADARRNLDSLNAGDRSGNAQLLADARACFEQAQLDRADAIVQQILSRDPGCAPAVFLQGKILQARRDFQAAADAFQRALDLGPRNAATLGELAQAQRYSDDLAAAVASAEEAVALAPESSLHQFRLGELYFTANQSKKCIDALERAIALDPENANAHNQLGATYSRLGRMAEASVSYLEALRLAPNNGRILANVANCLVDQGLPLEAHRYYRQALVQEPNSSVHSNDLFALHYVAGLSPEALFDAHREWADTYARPVLPEVPWTPGPHEDPNRRLRVGYLSGDFKSHSVAYFFEPLLAAHDRREVEVWLYSTVDAPDSKTKQLKAMADQFRDVAFLEEPAIAERIRADRIDILIDLSGHTGGNRQCALARKPAPIIVSWLGYPNTTGNPAIDYRFVDAIVEPEGTEGLSTERQIRLPNGFHCYQPPADAPDVEPVRVDDSDPIVFGSFNAVHKINAEVIALWARILNAVPGSQMFIKHRSLADPVTRSRYLGLFEAAGVAPERVQIMNALKEVNSHLAAYNRVDIALDTFPYNGTTTTAEALWMGVPVVTKLGDRHVARVSASLLHRVGLDALIAEDDEDYLRRAVSLAADRTGLLTLRRSIRAMMAASPLCDDVQFARDVEAAYRQMWTTYLAQAKPSAPAAAKAPARARAQAPEARTEPVRVLHHMARTGGTVISKCLASMAGTAMLSEAHPRGMTFIDPVRQAIEWFGLLSAEDERAIRSASQPFLEMTLRAHAKAQDAGLRLVLRDWSHIDFTGVPFVPDPSYTLTTAEVLKPHTEVVQTATVRHPIDQWLSLSRLQIVAGQLTLPAFLYGYRRFAEQAAAIGFVRYEDFTHDPDGSLATLCERLTLPFDAGYASRWSVYDRMTGDGVRVALTQGAITPGAPKAYDPDLLAAAAADPNYQAALDLLGYAHPPVHAHEREAAQ